MDMKSIVFIHLLANIKNIIMRKIFISGICFFILGAGNLFGQSLYEIIENPITKEYFLKSLGQEVKKEYPYTEPEFTEKNILEAFRRAYEECRTCFVIKAGSYYSANDIEQQKSLAANNSFNINFKEFITEGDFILREYVRDFGKEFRSKDFKTFKYHHSSALKEAGFKKKADQEALYNKILKKRKELGKKLVQLYGKNDYQMQLLRAFGEKYPELYKRSDYPSDEMKTLVVEKISPNFNLIDNILMYPEFTSKKNTEAENEELKKMLLDRGLVEITELLEPSDGYTFIFPRINDDLKKRADTLNRYFHLRNTSKAKWGHAHQRLLELWYGNLGNAFTLENFLTVCGSNVPSKEDFINNDFKPFKDVVYGYYEMLNGIVRGYFHYDREIKKSHKDILFENVLNNHYGIENDNFKKIKKEQAANKEKELDAKGGILRGRRYFKVNNQGRFDKLYFWSTSLYLERTINQSEYYGSFKKERGNLFKLILKDKKTGIELPEFEVRISSDGKKLYFGEDKVPYKYDDPDEANCLYEKDAGFWRSIDGKESFSTILEPTWKSSITGGIKGTGSLYKVSANKYAFVIYKTSWNGKLENNLVIITTDNNCDTIYYGKGKKKMVYVK